MNERKARRLQERWAKKGKSALPEWNLPLCTSWWSGGGKKTTTTKKQDTVSNRDTECRVSSLSTHHSVNILAALPKRWRVVFICKSITLSAVGENTACLPASSSRSNQIHLCEKKVGRCAIKPVATRLGGCWLHFPIAGGQIALAETNGTGTTDSQFGFLGWGQYVYLPYGKRVYSCLTDIPHGLTNKI